MRPRPKTVVGVDIGSSSIKVVGLKRASGDGYELEALGIDPIPHDAIVDGVIVSKSVVSETIDRIFKRNQIRNTRVTTSVSGHSVIVKMVTLPAQNEAELDEAIQWEAEQYIPFDISDVNLDYQVLRSTPEQKKIEVLLVAAKRDQITGQTEVISMAGKKPVLVDVDAFALQNAYETNYQPEPSTIAALLNIGSATMNISIVHGSEFLFTRDVSMGGNHYTQALQDEFSISFEEAEKYKREEAPSAELEERTTSVLESTSEILTLEVQKTFDYFRTTVHSDEIGELYLSGGAGRTKGLRDYLGRRFELPVRILDPFRRVRALPDLHPPDLLSSLAFDFSIAVGLALRSLGDR